LFSLFGNVTGKHLKLN